MIRDEPKTSGILRNFLEDQTGPRVSVRDIRDALGERAHGLLLFVFALPNIVPVGIPGVSTILGLPLILISLQLLVGIERPWFPRRILDRTISRPKLAAAITRGLPYLDRLERLLRPRLSWLTGPLAERVLALICLLLAIVLSLPIPFANWPPALAIALLALAIVEQDGLLYLFGLLAAAATVAILATFGAAFFVTVAEAANGLM